MTGSREEFRSWAEPAMHAAEAALARGDPSVRIGMWSHEDPVSLFGAVGVSLTGWDRLEPTFRAVAHRLSGGQDVTVRLVAFDVAQDMAYTAALVSFVGTLDGDGPREYRLRATTVFRREEGGWKAVHEHTDFQPPGAMADDDAPSDVPRQAPGPA